MKLSRWLIVAVLSTGCGSVVGQGDAPPTAGETAQREGAQTSTDPAVNPDAAVIADFKARVDKYVDLHKDLAKGIAVQKETSDPAKIQAARAALAARIQAARADAKHGDIFTLPIRDKFRRLLAPELKGEEGRDARAFLEGGAPAPGTVTFKVNAKYPENQPLPPMPANLLLNLPTLPKPLEYRIVEKHLILLDTAAGLVVDYAPNAIP